MNSLLLYLLFMGLVLVGYFLWQRRNRPQDTPQPYEPSVVDTAMISRLTAEKARGGTPEERDLADILQRWAPEAGDQTEYDEMARALLPTVAARADATQIAERLTVLMQEHFACEADNVVGIANYISNWWTLQQEQ